MIPPSVIGLPAALVHTYAALAIYADKGHRCHPSLPTIAASMNIDRRTLQRRLDALEDGGFLTRQRSTGRGHSTVYHLLGWKGGTSATLSGEVKGGIHDIKGGTSDRERVAPDPPQQTKGTNQEQRKTPRARSTALAVVGEPPRAQAVLDAFNHAFETRYSGAEWIKRIERRWPDGWTLEDWQAAMIAMHRDRWWERDGIGKPHPGMLIGKDGTFLQALRHQADDAVAAELEGRALFDKIDAMMGER